MWRYAHAIRSLSIALRFSSHSAASRINHPPSAAATTEMFISPPLSLARCATPPSTTLILSVSRLTLDLHALSSSYSGSPKWLLISSYLILYDSASSYLFLQSCASS